MLKQQLSKLSQYNRWANERCAGYILLAGEPVADQLLVSSFPTIRKTIYHIWDAELVWIKRLHGKTIASWPPSAGFTGSLEEGILGLLSVSDEFTGFIKSTSDEGLQEMMDYTTSGKKTFTNKACDMITHCFNHSTYHRGQVITMLRSAGFTAVGSTDFITYCRMAE